MDIKAIYAVPAPPEANYHSLPMDSNLVPMNGLVPFPIQKPPPIGPGGRGGYGCTVRGSAATGGHAEATVAALPDLRKYWAVVSDQLFATVSDPVRTGHFLCSKHIFPIISGQSSKWRAC